MRVRSILNAEDREGAFNLYWGDLHNHNAVGYAQGSLQRSIDVAQEHLDFFAFTGHASWHDMPKMPGDRHMKWVEGFRVHADHWQKTRDMIEQANSPDFVALLGYEWHSSLFGDYCMIFCEDQPDLFLPDDVESLLDFAQSRSALAIPHHVGYKRGWRGANFDHYRSSPSPVVEIFSEHGCTETDRAPYPMIRHSNGGRSTANTIVPQLLQGKRFGFVASSDNHRGFPGAYGEGVVGVWASELTRAALFEAIRARRTYAATGDRIVLEFSINRAPMGSEIAATSDRQIDIRVEGQDPIASIDLVRNGKVIQRSFPEDIATTVQLPGKAKCRLQYGWGPWAALDLGRVCDWDLSIALQGAEFLQAIPCFQSGPYDELRRDRLQIVSQRELALRSFTSRDACYAEDPTKSIVVEINGDRDALVNVQLRKPIEHAVQIPLAKLIEDNVVEFTGVFTSESYIVGRLMSETETSAAIRWSDSRNNTPADWYYVRVVQHNGQMAWSSPIWVG
jgi:hypothetical protein